MSPCPSFLLLLLLLSAPSDSTNVVDSDVVAELTSLRSDKDGVIRLSDHLLNRIMSVPRRSFSLVFFFDAMQLCSNPGLRLRHHRLQFGDVSYSFLANHADSITTKQLFFFDLEFKDSLESFSLFGVQTVPEVRVVSPSLHNLRASKAWDQERFKSLSAFVESGVASIQIGPLHHVSPLSPYEKAFLIAIVSPVVLLLLNRLLFGDASVPPNKDFGIRILFILLHYSQCVSGFIYCIVKRSLLFEVDIRAQDPLTKTFVYFYQGSETQYAAEMHAVALLYILVGVLLAGITRFCVEIEDVKEQRIAMYVALVICVWAVMKLISLHNWKTGHSLRSYWPSNWRGRHNWPTSYN